ncbi:MAG: hypothetical protein ACM3PY_14655, partial [Omnitrophica WOR_2 bacterium]
LLWGVLAYLETGARKYFLVITAMIVLEFAAKETAYIYTAQLLMFLAIYFVYRMLINPWKDWDARKNFVTWLIAGVFLGGGAGIFFLLKPEKPTGEAATTTPPSTFFGTSLAQSIMIALALMAVIALAVAAVYLVKGFTLKRIRLERSFDLLILVGTLILPLLTAFPLAALKLNVPTKAAEVNALSINNMILMGIGLGVMFLIAIVIGLWWNSREWLINFGLFYGIFVVFYTTLFTNGAGIFTGLLGSLAYWLAQQAVNRGSQPWYYYALIQVPVYEYLPAIGSLLALGLALAGIRPAIERMAPQTAPAAQPDPALHDENSPEYPLETASDAPLEIPIETVPEKPPVLALLGFWAVTALFAYSYAGEKMPWLTVHITLPMILLAGWSIGYLIDSFDWERLKTSRGLVVALLIPVFFISLGAALAALLGPNPPFQGKTLDQLAATSTFMAGFLGAVVSGWGLVSLLKDWPGRQVIGGFSLAAFGFLGLLTMRSAFQASFIQYDQATELLVYAHCGPGIKDALAQIEELSRRTTDGLAMPIAYDNETTYPYWWYLRDFTDQRYYAANPTRDLRNVPAILVGDANYGKVEPIVGNAYYKFEYIRMWWPDQSYFDLNWNRISYALFNPQMRTAIFNIWLNHDYTLYASLNKKDLSLPNWEPSAHMRLYLRKDLVAQLWKYGTAPSQEPVVADPYVGKELKISADRIIGTQGNQDGQFNMPRNMALAPDGSLYVADSGNNRIQHMTADGKVIKVWGTSGAINGANTPPGGTFNEPWGITVGKDGSVYVADTWNHRIQKFTASGDFVKMWGYFGQAETPTAIWGPRALAFDKNGHLMVTDTGNKRVVIFDTDGNFIAQFGSSGAQPGQFDEPVGLATDSSGKAFIADTWNQRVQVMAPDAAGTVYSPVTSWDISGWYGQSLDNKPYIAVDNQDHVFVTDPEGYRVLEFNGQGQIIRYWGDFGTTPDKFGLPNGIIWDGKDGVWVADAANGRIMHFTLPK